MKFGGKFMVAFAIAMVTATIAIQFENKTLIWLIGWLAGNGSYFLQRQIERKEDKKE